MVRILVSMLWRKMHAPGQAQVPAYLGQMRNRCANADGNMDMNDFVILVADTEMIQTKSIKEILVALRGDSGSEFMSKYEEIWCRGAVGSRCRRLSCVTGLVGMCALISVRGLTLPRQGGVLGDPPSTPYTESVEHVDFCGFLVRWHHGSSINSKLSLGNIQRVQHIYVLQYVYL